MNNDSLSIVVSFLKYKEYINFKLICKQFSKISDEHLKDCYINKLMRGNNKNIVSLTIENIDFLHIYLNINLYFNVRYLSMINVTDTHRCSDKIHELFPNIKSLKTYRDTKISYDNIHKCKQLKVIHIDISNMNYKVPSYIFNLPNLEYVFVNTEFSLPNVFIVKSEHLKYIMVNTGHYLRFLSKELEYVSNGVCNNIGTYKGSNLSQR